MNFTPSTDPLPIAMTTLPPPRRPRASVGRLLLCLWLTVLVAGPAPRAAAGALEDYVHRPDTNYAWRLTGAAATNGGPSARVRLTSQRWRDGLWQHDLRIVRPAVVRNPDIAFLFITGSGSGEKEELMLRLIIERAGAVGAVLTQVPNQPLYDGRKEDALIAYTFSQYLATGDTDWPLLFPMVKSAVRALDTVRDYSKQENGQEIRRFVVAGASKRGWTTWLTAAVDERVAGIAPMVIDMLNMRQQTAWAAKVYGRQSEQIRDYTDAGLVGGKEDPRRAQLREWVDPYSYRARYRMPKLILLGTNDPYWTVDSLRHYWADLPEPKLVYQTPNAGHNLNGGFEALPTLATFFQLVADRKPLPEAHWQIEARPNELTLQSHVNVPAISARMWTATSTNRDFRGARWTSSPVALGDDHRTAEIKVTAPATGHQAFLLETEVLGPTGEPYHLSTEARVLPDLPRDGGK